MNSQFHLSYNMVLNLLRVDEVDPEYLMSRSFHQFQNDRCLPEMEKRLKTLETELNAVSIENEQEVQEYYAMKLQLEKMRQQLRAIVTTPIHALPYLQPGRLVRVVDGNDQWGWGVVVNFQKRAKDASVCVTYLLPCLILFVSGCGRNGFQQLFRCGCVAGLCSHG